jgi:hypothetical protein
MPAKKATPPQDLPTYRILTGPDDAAFCHRVSEALALGYLLYGSPAATFNGQHVIVAQAVIWPSVQGSVAQRKEEQACKLTSGGTGEPPGSAPRYVVWYAVHPYARHR